MSRTAYDAGGGVSWRNRVKHWREQRGLSQNALAERAAMHGSNVSAFESHAREPNVGSLIRLASALGVTIDALITVTEE